MNDIRLSKHFMLSEFLRSSTATARGIDNTPGASAIGTMPASPKTAIEIISYLQALCVNVLEPLREYFNCPIVISSGYRCPALNKAVGGASNSQHILGEACDIRIPNEAAGKKWFAWMKDNLPFDSLIWEKSSPSSTKHWIHVSYRQNSEQRKNVVGELVKYT